MKLNRRESLEEYVYEEIKSAIFNRKIPVKMQLSEEQLAEAFSVSRTPIRSVLKRLQYEKIIQIIPNKGAFINLPSQKEIEEVFHLRSIIEVEAVKMACRSATEKQLSDLEELTNQEDQFYKQGDYHKAIQMTTEFHLGLVMLSGNELMVNYSRELINMTNIYLVYHDNADQESPLCPSEHRSILQAIRERDEEEAVRVFLDHVSSVINHLDSEKANEEVQFSEIFKPYLKYEDEKVAGK
ncbi:GntR family transcriptional regulator [Ammoniphilus sp. YIM 78166]|uniref:GntR family transcriptional regulator n=1 Tax=Ammoniphilus sp. YIM 78166 TaxID=1644106 RepID=UPI00106F7951|nr:GntR family transcriptional regulator [Ammoniphilus sp. YIM 78166]